MALPSLASRPPPELTEPVPSVMSAPRSALAGAHRAHQGHPRRQAATSRLAQLVAGKVFLVRVANAMLALGTQVLLARWMGSFEFGVYIYVWTWVLMIGALSDVGLSSAARRFIPEYTELSAFDRLRGFLAGIALARLRHRHRDRRGRRARRDAARALSRSLHDHSALSRLRHHPDLRPGAGAGRRRAILRLAQSGADAVLHHPPARHHRPDGRGLSVRRADRRGDRDGRSPSSPPGR